MAKAERVPVYSPAGKYTRKRRPFRKAATPKQTLYIQRLMESRSTSLRLDILPGLTIGEASGLIQWLQRTPTTYRVERLIAIRSALELTDCKPLSAMSAGAVNEEILLNWKRLVTKFLPDRTGNAKFDGTCDWCQKPITIGVPLKRIPFVEYWIHESCGPTPPPGSPANAGSTETPSNGAVVRAEFSDFQIEGAFASAKVRAKYSESELRSKWEWFETLSEERQVAWCYENRADGIGWFFSAALEAQRKRVVYEVLRPASDVPGPPPSASDRLRALFRRIRG